MTGEAPGLSPGVWGRCGHPLWSTAVGLGFGGKARENRGRVREVLAKLCGRSGEGRCASLQTRVRSLAPRLAGGRVRASAPRAAVLWGAPRAVGVSRYKENKQNKKARLAPKLISALGILPSLRFLVFLQ